MNNKGTKLLLIFTFFSVYIIYLFWRAAYTIPFNFGWFPASFGILLYIAELVGFIESAIFYITLWDTKTPSTPDVEDKDYPDVDVLIATYNEPTELLYKTLIGCRNMDYPNKERVHIYICDDGNRKNVASLCEYLEIGYITRTENTYAKAGNLNNALSQTNSPYIVTFDADMIPMHDFLMKTIPFYLTGQRIGFVQVPQNFYNPDPFQYNLFVESSVPNEQDLFSRLIQAGKSRFNSVIYAGSNTVISREALNAAGGIVVDTITEDFATGMKIESKGYKAVYLNEVHASGLSPENLTDLYNQRIRWGRGVIQTFKKHNPLRQKGLRPIQKIMYLSSLSYWYFGVWRFIYFLAPIMYSVFNIIVLNASAISMLEIWLPMFLLSKITFYVFAKNVRTTAWSHIYDTIMFPQITLGAMMETLGFKLSKFKVTPKDNVTRKKFVNQFKMVTVQLMFAALSLAGLLRLIYLTVNNSFSTSFIINTFWLGYNLYLLIMAIFFSSERPKFRNNERLLINITVFIYTTEDKIICGDTYDISENGVSIVLDNPIYLDPDETHRVELFTERYCAECQAGIIRVDDFHGKYKYVFNFEMDEPNYRQLIGILYDRIPCMPKTISKNNVLKNIRSNIKNRMKEIHAMSRKLPRIPVCKDVIVCVEEEQIVLHMEDYNFKYCKFKTDKAYPRLNIPLNVSPKLELNCVLIQKLIGKKGNTYCIYCITNYVHTAHLDVNSHFISPDDPQKKAIFQN